jgi:hypothetical protein
MPDPPEKRLLYVALIGMGAILPLAINRDFGAPFSLVSILCVVLFIQSDRKRTSARPGFPVIFKPAPQDSTGLARNPQPDEQVRPSQSDEAESNSLP